MYSATPFVILFVVVTCIQSTSIRNIQTPTADIHSQSRRLSEYLYNCSVSCYQGVCFPNSTLDDALGYGLLLNIFPLQPTLFNAAFAPLTDWIRSPTVCYAGVRLYSALRIAATRGRLSPPDLARFQEFVSRDAVRTAAITACSSEIPSDAPPNSVPLWSRAVHTALGIREAFYEFPELLNASTTIVWNRFLSSVVAAAEWSGRACALQNGLVEDLSMLADLVRLSSVPGAATISEGVETLSIERSSTGKLLSEIQYMASASLKRSLPDMQVPQQTAPKPANHNTFSSFDDLLVLAAPTGIMPNYGASAQDDALNDVASPGPAVLSLVAAYVLAVKQGRSRDATGFLWMRDAYLTYIGTSCACASDFLVDGLLTLTNTTIVRPPNDSSLNYQNQLFEDRLNENRAFGRGFAAAVLQPEDNLDPTPDQWALPTVTRCTAPGGSLYSAASKVVLGPRHGPDAPFAFFDVFNLMTPTAAMWNPALAGSLVRLDSPEGTVTSHRWSSAQAPYPSDTTSMAVLPLRKPLPFDAPSNSPFQRFPFCMASDLYDTAAGEGQLDSDPWMQAFLSTPFISHGSWGYNESDVLRNLSALTFALRGIVTGVTRLRLSNIYLVGKGCGDDGVTLLSNITLDREMGLSWCALQFQCSYVHTARFGWVLELSATANVWNATRPSAALPSFSRFSALNTSKCTHMTFHWQISGFSPLKGCPAMPHQEPDKPCTASASPHHYEDNFPFLIDTTPAPAYETAASDLYRLPGVLRPSVPVYMPQLSVSVYMLRAEIGPLAAVRADFAPTNPLAPSPRHNNRNRKFHQRAIPPFSTYGGPDIDFTSKLRTKTLLPISVTRIRVDSFGGVPNAVWERNAALTACGPLIIVDRVVPTEDMVGFALGPVYQLQRATVIEAPLSAAEPFAGFFILNNASSTDVAVLLRVDDFQSRGAGTSAPDWPVNRTCNVISDHAHAGPFNNVTFEGTRTLSCKQMITEADVGKPILFVAILWPLAPGSVSLDSLAASIRTRVAGESDVDVSLPCEVDQDCISTYTLTFQTEGPTDDFIRAISDPDCHYLDRSSKIPTGVTVGVTVVCIILATAAVFSVLYMVLACHRRTGFFSSVIDGRIHDSRQSRTSAARGSDEETPLFTDTFHGLDSIQS